MSTDSHGYDTDPAQNSGFALDPRPSRAGARGRVQAARSDKAPPRRRRKARLVHRVVRHIDIWTLAKIGAVYVACAYVVALISGFILWRAADIAGTIDGIEGFMEDTGGYDSFEMRGEVVFSSAVLIGAVLSVLAVCLVILAGILFNLISDLTGGIRMTVIDEDLLVTPARRGARPRRDDVAPVYDPDPDPDAESAGEPEFERTYEDEPIDDAPVDESEVTTPVPTVAEEAEIDDTELDPEPQPAASSSSWVDPEPDLDPVVSRPWVDPEPDPDPVTSRSWTEPEPDPAPPSFRDDAAPSTHSPPTEPAVESAAPADPVWPDPVGPAPEPVATPAEPDPAPVGDVDPVFDRLVAGNANESPSRQSPFGEPDQAGEPDRTGESDQTGDGDGDDRTDATESDSDGADSAPQDETKPRFEIDFG